MSQAGKRKGSNNHVADPSLTTAGSSSSSLSSSLRTKRVRIDEPRADETDFFDGDPELDEQQHNGRTRRQRKRQITQDDMGEDSSSDDNDDDEPALQHKNDDEEDEDMFDVAGSEDDRPSSKGKAKAKAKEGKAETTFLDLEQLDVGQEFSSTTRAGLDDGMASTDEEADPDLELEETDSGTDDDDDDGTADLNAYNERTPPTSPGGTPLPAPLRRGRRKRAKPPKITGFNVTDELKTGRFDADGNYHEGERDAQAHHDAWLSGVYSKSKIRAARLAQQQREREAAQKERQSERDDGDEDQVRKNLTHHMLRGETVQRTLQRLGKRAAELRKSKAAVASGNDAVELETERAKAAQEVERVTHLSSALMSRFGQLDVYEETYESLLQTVRKSGLVRQTFDPAAQYDPPSSSSTTTTTESAATSAGLSTPSVEAWEYRWTPGYLAEMAHESGTSVAPDVEVFGPFSYLELTLWSAEGYFGTHNELVLVRRAKSKDPWLRFNTLQQKHIRRRR